MGGGQAAVEPDRKRSLSGTRTDRTVVPATVQPNTLPAPTRRSTRIPKSNVRLSDYQLMVENVLCAEPTTVEEILSSSQRHERKAVMQAKFEALVQNGTWVLVEEPKSKPGIPAKILTSR